MSPVILSLVVFIVLFVALALFARGGGTETVRVTEPRTRLPENLTTHAPRVLSGLGLKVDKVEAREGMTEVWAHKDGPVVGQRLAVWLLAPEAPPVGAAQVQAASDAARGLGLDKVVLVSPAGYSDEARQVAVDAPVELLTAARWVELDAALARSVARGGLTAART